MPARRCRREAHCEFIVQGRAIIGCPSHLPIPARGSSRSILQRIFDLYFTTKEKGSGIGLSMVFRTIQMHDGEIEVQSTPGAGTTFRVLLPRA